jgi:hypothetical protein
VYHCNRKKGFIILPSHKIIVWKLELSRNSVNRMEVQLGGVKPSWDHQMYHVERLNLPPHFDFSDVGKELYTECLGTIPQNTHTDSHRIINLIISNIISLIHLTLRKSKNSFLCCHYASLLTRSLGFRVVFQISLEHFGPHLTRPNLLPATTRTFWSEWTRAWWPPLS